jgi:hypothetical protein
MTLPAAGLALVVVQLIGPDWDGDRRAKQLGDAGNLYPART